MSEYSSYFLYQKYIKIGTQDWVPVYPIEYAISGDTGQDPVVYKENDPACGYVPVEPIYRWHQLPISEDYECSAGTKYYKEVYQVSYDNGLTWEDVVPEQTRRGDLYETGSSDCIEYRWINIPISEDYICDDCPAPQYRWVVSTGYVCSGTNKMTREIEEVSYDSGTTWTPTGDERAALPIIEADSPDCGYVPPTPTFEGKWKATYTGGTTSSAQCDSTSAITRNEINKTNIISVEIGDCVTSIGNSAFNGYSGLTDITISDSVTSIGQYAFLGCYALSSATIPNSVTSISGSAFSSCYSLTSVTIPDSVTSIGDYVFRHSSGLTSAIIGNGITSIGQETFYSCSGLTSVTIGNSVTNIGPNVFNWCTSLTSVTIPNSVTSIGNGAFSNCSGLTSVTIGNSVTSIGNQAFSDCRSLTSVTIPNNVTSIGDGAFSYCSGLTSVIIGNSVTSIGNSVFFECSSLTSVTVQAITPPTIGTYVFYNTNNNLKIYVPAASVSAYKSATNWSSYASRIQAIP